MRTPLLIAAALAISVAVPARSETGSTSVTSSAASAQRASLFGLRRNIAGRGVSLSQGLTQQSALALSASSGNRKELPEVRVLLGVQYTF